MHTDLFLLKDTFKGTKEEEEEELIREEALLKNCSYWLPEQARWAYLARSELALVLEAPPSFQAPSPSSSIVDEFNRHGPTKKCLKPAYIVH